MTGKGRGGRRANQTGRPPTPPEKRAQWARPFHLRVPPALRQWYDEASAEDKERARQAMIEALQRVKDGN